jgi:hypothetical protein
LRIKIDEQDALSLFRQRRTEVYCRRGFADTTFLIRNRVNFHCERGPRGCMRSPEFPIAILLISFIAELSMCVTRRCDGHRPRATKDRPARVAFL